VALVVLFVPFMQELEHLKFTDAQKQRMRVGDASIVRVKHARISLLSPWSFRIEFSATDTFHDDPSLAFWYRAPPSPPAFQVRGADQRC